MSEHENIIDENDEIIDDIPKIEEPIKKNKKPITAEKLEQLKQARLKGAEKKREMKELKNKAKQLPIEEVKLSAMKYDQLQKQKEELIKPKEEIKEEIVIPKEEKPKTIDKKKRIIKKIIYEDGSEDEVEDIRHIQQKKKYDNV